MEDDKRCGELAVAPGQAETIVAGMKTEFV